MTTYFDLISLTYQMTTYIDLHYTMIHIHNRTIMIEGEY